MDITGHTDPTSSSEPSAACRGACLVGARRRELSHRQAVSISFILGALSLCASRTLARDLSFEERVKAQEAIERVYYSHQSGATKPFEQAVPRSLLESKVRTYLKQSVALETIWRTPVTSEALQRELERMLRSSRTPARLEEIFRALGRDSFLIQECFVRPVLVDRLARNFLETDARFQGGARTRMDLLRKGLLRNPRSRPDRGIDLKVVDVLAEDPDGLSTGGKKARAAEWDEVDGVFRHTVGRAEFDRLRASAPTRAGQVGQVVERPGSFDVRVLLEASDRRLRIADYTVGKLSWDEWWSDAKHRFNERAVAAIARTRDLPTMQDVAATAASSTACVPDDIWAGDGLDDPPVASSFGVAVWTGTEMLTWGGSSSGAARYDPLTDTWGRLATKNAPPAGYVTAVWTGSEMIVWGLDDPSHSGRYDPLSDTWRPISAAGAPPAAQAAIWTGTTMIVWGGWPGIAGGRYDPATDTWSPVSTAGAPGPRGTVYAVWSGKEMIVWGGYDGNGYVNTGGRYDPAADTWAPISTIGAPAARDGHTLVWANGLMIVWGGYDGAGSLGTGARYDPATDTWTPVSATNAPSTRFSDSATWTGSEMMVWGGRDAASYDYLDSGARYDPAADLWRPMTTANAPSPRSGHVAVWTGERLVVWGGFDSSGDLASGGRYDPGSDSWTPTSISNRPSISGGHSAVWTGNQMIIWGGYSDGIHPLDSGARFDPATAAWTATSTLNAPSPRSGHVAVWTGSRMVIWGGFTGEDFRGTGGRYDPLTDSWSPTSTVNAPFWSVFRVGASAVWTGARMIVWGGRDTGDRYISSGGRYDPQSDTWLPTSPDNAPPARAYHTALWTGSEMLLWGGFVRPFGGPDTWLDDGYAYLPATDSWRPLVGAGAPSPRENHSAVWTGQQMLVWGGDGPDPVLGSVHLSDGAAYDPGQDSWEEIPTAGASLQLHEHTAVWAGRAMIVWGYTGSPSEGAGGRYDPVTRTWKTVSRFGAPFLKTGSGTFTAPAAHTAVWTGDEMIVWGGGVETGSAYKIDLSPDADGDGFTVCAGDCDDADAAIHPGAVESCNGRDDNCDGQVDEGFGAGASCAQAVDACHQVIGTLACSADGTKAECVGPVTLVDTTPPTLSAGTTPSILWPPNHRMVDVTESVTASDDCSVPTITLVSVTSLEPDDAPGDEDGETTGDIQGADPGTADFAFALRAERSGDGRGRSYLATYSAVDGSGNSSSATSIIFVPHDEDGRTEPIIFSVENDADGSRLAWGAVPGAISYSVIRGSLAALRDADNSIDLGAVTCIQPSSPATDTQQHPDAGMPPVGQAFFYLVSYNDGQDSGYGTVTAPKPEIPTGGGCGQVQSSGLAAPRQASRGQRRESERNQN